MKRIITLIVLTAAFYSCGIEEYYFLPPAPEGDRIDITVATIHLPSISHIYYATGYTIYYRIYLSSTDITSTITQPQMTSINSTLNSDYNALFRFTDISDNASVATTTTFTNRNFHKLEVINGNDEVVPVSNVLTNRGGNLIINFFGIPGTPPVLNINGSDYILYRSHGFDSFEPIPDDDLRFFSTTELNSNENATSTINADVARSGTAASGIFDHAYVAMYLAAEGQNPVNFQQIISNPTFLSVFKLPRRF